VTSPALRVDREVRVRVRVRVTSPALRVDREVKSASVNDLIEVSKGCHVGI